MNKKYYLQYSVLALLAVAIWFFSISYLTKSHETKSLWEISLWVFALFGMLITLGAAIPAITAIFSYQTFIKQSEKAWNDLAKIEKQQQDVQQKIAETLPNLEQKFNSLKQLLLADETKKQVYELLKKGDKLTEKERDELFYVTESSSYQLYNCSLYQLIAIKQQEVWQFEGEIAQEKAQYGEVRLYDYEMRLETLNKELAELYRIASLIDDDFKPFYLQQLIAIWTDLADRKKTTTQAPNKETYLVEQMKVILLRFIQFNENNIAHIQVNEKHSKELLEFAKQYLSQQEIDKLVNPYKSSEMKFSNILKEQVLSKG